MSQLIEITGSPIGLEFLPDETLFSWCSRYHQVAANGLDRTTCRQLFGHHRIGAAHDFPARIDALVARSNGTLGAAAEIIRHRTVLPFYLPFKPIQLCRQAVAALQGEGIGPLKYRLGLLTSGLGAAHPLKVCPLCIDHDLACHGWAYWHRSHQLPGVWLCPQHHVPLLLSRLKLEQRARFAWLLPMPAQCGSVTALAGVSSGAAPSDWLLKLARLSCELMGRAAADFIDPIRIAGTFRGRLAEMGVTHPSGRIRWQEADRWLDQLAVNMASVPSLNLQADKELLRTQLIRLLSGRSLTHPLRYLGWIAAWFESLEDFAGRYSAAKMNSAGVTKDPESTAMVGVPDLNRDQVLASVRLGKTSLTAAAKLLGVSYTTIAVWGCHEQIVAPRRPKKLDDHLWIRAVGMLQSGQDKEEVARACQISVVSVTRILRTVPELQDQWHRIRHERRGTAARQTWESLSRLHAYMGVKALRRLEPAAYAWLYRNDQKWLKASLASVVKLPAANHAVMRMQRADARMAEALKRLALTRSQSASSWSFDELKSSLPALTKALHQPERWPLTIQSLAFVSTATDSTSPLLDRSDG